jgi:hypothetical protein
LRVASGRAWCAEDTLFLPALLAQTAVVESYSPGTHRPVHLIVGPENIEEAHPSGAVVSIVVVDAAKADMSSVQSIWTTFCHHVHFFPSREEAEQWAEGRTDIEIRPIAEAYDFGKQVWSRVLRYDDRSSTSTVTRASSLLPVEQATEDAASQLEAFDHRHARSRHRGIRGSPRPQMFFRPEEVDRRSEGVRDPASLLGSPAEPQHDAVSLRPGPARVGRKREGHRAVVAARPNLDSPVHHRRDPERVERAARVPLVAPGESDDEPGRESREGVGEVHMAVVDADQVVPVQRDHRVADGQNGPLRERGCDVVHGYPPAPLEEGAQDPLEHTGLRGGTAHRPPGFQVLVDQLVCGLDLKGRHTRPSSSSIGWVKLKTFAGTSSWRASSMAAINPSRVEAVRHCSGGLSQTRMSLVSMPMGSVAISGRPVLETTVTTSGNRLRARSIVVVLASDSGRATLGRRRAWTARALRPAGE